MVYLVGPVEAELLQNQLEHLEVVVLLVTDHIDMGVEAVFLEPLLSGAEILGDIDRSSVGAKQQLAVEAVGGQVAPHRTVGITLEHALVESALHEFLAEQIGVMLIIGLVEGYAESLVGLVEAGEHPGVHLFPEGAHFGVTLLPFDEHLVHLVDDGRVFLLHLRILDIAVAYQMVALLAGALRRGAVETLLPGVHGLANMHSPVVDESHLYHFIACGLEKIRHGRSEQIVAHMPEVQGLVRIGRGEFDHDPASGRRQLAVAGVGRHRRELFLPVYAGQREVQETLHRIEGGNLRAVRKQPFPDGVSCGVRSLAGDLEQREDHESVVALELLASGLHLKGRGRYVRAIDCLDGL